VFAAAHTAAGVSDAAIAFLQGARPSRWASFERPCFEWAATNSSWPLRILTRSARLPTANRTKVESRMTGPRAFNGHNRLARGSIAVHRAIDCHWYFGVEDAIVRFGAVHSAVANGARFH
jgi:hypothetical protein